MLCSKIYGCIFGADSQEGEANHIFASIFQCCSKKNVSANRRNDFTNRENRAEKHLNSFPQRSLHDLAEQQAAGASGCTSQHAAAASGQCPQQETGSADGEQDLCAGCPAAQEPEAAPGEGRRPGKARSAHGDPDAGGHQKPRVCCVNQMRARGGVTKLRFRQGLRLQGGQLNNAGVLVSCGARNGLGLRGRGRGAGPGLRGRGGFRGRGMGKPKKIPTKEELDNQLDNYMSMTKSHLDAELDSYMAMAGSDYME
ncbi:uncharacterized protein LOC115176702 isoform X5 [Salmo trutta]|uniref:uncharacterized protein LOC115176702 isoform X5 n=1 Tax=Salmo trutta TaxID=8032 RepID=UPI00113159F8|nr:uncharacterized protein LOC115176702 isoform X5 [Salmo trutta]